jgi:hypothetical protein
MKTSSELFTQAEVSANNLDKKSYEVDFPLTYPGWKFHIWVGEFHMKMFFFTFKGYIYMNFRT